MADNEQQANQTTEQQPKPTNEQAWRRTGGRTSRAGRARQAGDAKARGGPRKERGIAASAAQAIEEAVTGGLKVLPRSIWKN